MIPGSQSNPNGLLRHAPILVSSLFIVIIFCLVAFTFHLSHDVQVLQEKLDKLDDDMAARKSRTSAGAQKSKKSQISLESRTQDWTEDELVFRSNIEREVVEISSRLDTDGASNSPSYLRHKRSIRTTIDTSSVAETDLETSSEQNSTTEQILVQNKRIVRSHTTKSRKHNRRNETETG